MEILVTGCAGFIGAALARRLLQRGDEIIGVDNLNDYYDPGLKQDRLALLADFAKFSFRKLDISDREQMENLFREVAPERVVHLAAQAGVRYSISHPHSYINSNIAGFLNILEGCRSTTVEHLVYASSSSVYGANEKLPYAESDPVAHPVSLYGATKRANELMAHSYSHLYDIPVTGLRYFTVYGPLGQAGHVPHPVCRENICRRTDTGVQPGRAPAGFYLYRRRGGGNSENNGQDPRRGYKLGRNPA